jgi:mediator of RNA polymerase II transcription subunit 5
MAWNEYVRRQIDDALIMARSQKIPSLDVDTCLALVSPSEFLKIMWQTLCQNATVGLGDIENCRRLVTFILTMPPAQNRPPLLPIFLHVAVPTILRTIDLQQGPEQALIRELLSTTIMTTLTAAMHLELALRGAPGEHYTARGQSSAALARKLALDLRAQQLSQANQAMLERFSSSQSFVGNFPVFLEDGKEHKV